jgi:iron complex outermembrane recepter protein
VQIIQTQPKPVEVAPEAPKPPEVAKKKPVPVEPPPPVVAQPKPQPKPKPVQQAQPQTPPPQPQPAPAVVQPVTAPPLSTEVKISPIGGSEIPISKVSGSVSRVSVEDIKRTGATDAQSLLQTSVPGVIVTDLQGNGFQTDVQYRGFSSSPVNGVPQGLAIYQNGVRINESFGDIVNWDFLPSNAINDITVVAGNPVFGLNAIGGAISIGMKDGFNSEGTEIDVRGGSFGRIQGAFSTGQRSGAVAAFVALEGAHDDGWRENSPADIKRMYVDLGYKTKEAEFHINFTGAENFVGAVTAAPVELLDLDYTRTYTFPQTTNNDLKMVSVNGTVSVTDTLKLSGLAYRRKFTQKHIDANIVDATDCGDGTLCLGGEQALGAGVGVNANGTIPAGIAGAGGVLGSIDNTSQDAGSMGASVQAVEKSRLFGLGNQFLVGASYDHGDVRYGAASTLGKLGPKFVVTPLGIDIVGPDDLSPRSLTTANDYYGVYFSDTLDVTDKLAVTVGGRFNVADLSIRDLTGRDPFLNADSHYQRFNPQVGATYSFVPGLTLYGSYSQANRAPTPAELACADPLNPCLIESFLTADPPLNQVVSHTYELGLRGEQTSWSGREKFEWGVGLFRTLNTDDIISVAAQTTGRGFFQNAGDTLRQGVEANVSYRTDKYFLYANYNFTDATYETALTLGSPNNPSATLCPGADPKDPNAPTCVNVLPGNTIPGIPQHKFKAGFDYWITPEWKFGADVIASSSQVFFGDEGNQNKRLAGYAKVNLHTSYDINGHVQLYGLVDNLFDKKFGTFGNYFDTAAATSASLGEINFTDPRTVVPSAPIAIYGGMKVKF